MSGTKSTCDCVQLSRSFLKSLIIFCIIFIFYILIIFYFKEFFGCGKSKKSRASVSLLSLAGTRVAGEYEQEKYRVPQFNNVDLDVLGLFTSRTERRPVKFKFSLEKLKS